MHYVIDTDMTGANRTTHFDDVIDIEHNFSPPNGFIRVLFQTLFLLIQQTLKDRRDRRHLEKDARNAP